MKKLLELNNFLKKSGFKFETNILKNIISINPKIASFNLEVELITLKAQQSRLEDSRNMLNDMLTLTDDEIIEKYNEKMKFTRFKNPVLFREKMIQINTDRINKLEIEIADRKNTIEILKEK